MSLAVAAVDEHPIYVPLSPAVQAKLVDQGHADWIEQHERLRLASIIMERNDPLRHGHEPPMWLRADEQLRILREKFPKGVLELLVLGGNRAAKSTWAVKRCVQLMCNKPGARVWFLHSSEAASKSDQQPMVFKFLPPEWRPEGGRLRQGRGTKIIYTDSDGFVSNKFSLPNGSQAWFKFYGGDVKNLEGTELDAAAADELITPPWIETLRFRLVNLNGIFLITFTPVEHFTDTVKMYLKGAITLEEAEAELLPLFDKFGQFKGFDKVPRIQQPTLPNARIIYFHTSDNPFGNYEGMKAQQIGASRERILMRVYGVPSETHGAQFGFNSNVHKITREQFAALEAKYPDATRYLLVDPCSGRNWFMGWAFCPFPGKVIWYREWPSPGKYIEGIGDPGNWAELGGTAIRREGKAPLDGDPGLAQKPFRFGLRRYLEEIEKCETKLVPSGPEANAPLIPFREKIFERWIDSRYGNSAVTDREGQTTLIEQLDELGAMFCAMLGETKILHVQDGSIDLINSALAYDKDKAIGEFSDSLGRVNEPMMMITEDCPNMEFAFINWTGEDGLHGACKDPIDIVRGFVLSRLGYVGPETFQISGGSAGY